jgi:hypothetical protein
MSLVDIRAPNPNQAVFDVADPDRHGKIIRAGEQQSEVRFDDGAERVIPNDHLRQIETSKVELDNPVLPAVPDAVRQGQEAWERLRKHSTWEDWKKVGAAHVIGRTEAMRDGHVNKPKGRSYNAAFNAWQKKFGFTDFDSGDRTRLFQVMDNLEPIEVHLKTLKLPERLRLNHPSTVLRHWKAAVKAARGEQSEKRVSPVQKLKDELVAVIEERDLYKREVDLGGGDLWTPQSTPKQIAKIMVGKLTKSKAENVAREILRMLKGKANK